MKSEKISFICNNFFSNNSIHVQTNKQKTKPLEWSYKLSWNVYTQTRESNKLEIYEDLNDTVIVIHPHKNTRKSI